MIKLFEIADQSDIVIRLAELAMNVAQKLDHPDVVSSGCLREVDK